MRFSTIANISAACACAVLLSAIPASAQSPPPDQQNQGPLVVEQVHDGFVVAPDFKITEINHDTGAVIGGYGGVVVQKSLLLGAGAYWLANGGHDTDMAYGGFVVGWLMNSDKPVGFNLRSLVGFGGATVRDQYLVTVPGDVRFGRPPTTTVQNVYYDQNFFVFEPQADFVVRFADWLRLTCGAGYRVIGGTHVDDHLRGVTGSVAFQFGTR